MAEFEKVVVVGLGYIGLPTAAVIASRGMQVIGVDVNELVVKTVASGSIHIAEPDLEGLVQKVVSSGSLKLATNAPGGRRIHHRRPNTNRRAEAC